MSSLEIKDFTSDFIPRVMDFADRYIGENYFTVAELEKFTTPPTYSLVLWDQDSGRVKGLRLSLGAGDWMTSLNLKKVHPELWGVSPQKVAYFKTIFLSDDLRGQSWGVELSRRSLEALKKAGHKAVVCHSWKESPNDSSRRYLEKLGFKALIDIPRYWEHIDYDCIRCGKPCVCSATEMICYL